MPPTHSVIVPAYKEAGNLDALTRRVFAACENQGFAKGTVEIIIVDDNSRDGSVEVIDKLRKEGYNVTSIVRTTERGLSSAVLHGFKVANGQYLLCMDADLQHPPEAVPSLLRCFDNTNTEFVLGTRYGKGVEIDKDWPVHRRVISWGARILARPLTSLSDPMSGFFGLRKDVLGKGLKAISPIGYKVALEIFVKCQIKSYEEVAFNFAPRTIGESKLTGKVIVHYLKHLRMLYDFSFGTLFYVIIALLVIIAFYVLHKVLALIL
eukprot:TRINITY_DN22307_c0_g1_i4.p1 TRINITY_DN22307_c0_g1~~TRINITY_DN22307_c0_g1_i4.p1  ORF type:complete len:265 (+),score=61.72 TRINITY_DN22307_c0_g1_i4:41-835(+)